MAKEQIKSLSTLDEPPPPPLNFTFSWKWSSKQLACLSFTKAQTRPTIQSDNPLMKAGSNYLYNPLPTKGSSQEHRDEISAYLSQHHSPKTNTPVCLWHTKAVINMAHWSERMYSHSIRRQLSLYWREGKMFTMHWFGLGAMPCEDQIIEQQVKATAAKKEKRTFHHHVSYNEWQLHLTFWHFYLKSESKEETTGNIASLIVGTCPYQNSHWFSALGFYLFTMAVLYIHCGCRKSQCNLHISL